MARYIVTGTTDRSRSGTSEVVFEKDGNGNPTKFVSKTHPEELSAEDCATLDSLGVTYEKVSAEEAKEIEASVAQSTGAASDTAGAAPIFGSSAPNTTPTNKSSTSGERSSGNSKSRR